MKTIGDNIKTLRLSAGFSQTQLADKLGISSQAVSKWETNFSQPDITLLPEIATVFGVRIDDLFDYTKDKMFDHIDSSLSFGNPMTHQTFVEFESFLLSEIALDVNHYRAQSTLGFLYLRFAEQLKKKAVQHAKKALELNPNSKADINVISIGSDGALYDWDARNHHELIDYFQKTLKIAPENKRLYFYILDNLIADGRLDEAETFLQESYEHNPDVLNAYYQILIDEHRYGFAHVKAEYQAYAVQHEDDWRALFSVANSLSQNGAYQEAIEVWEKAYKAQEKPRFTDYHESIAICYLRLNDKPNAVKAYQKVLDVLRDDWDCKFGSYVDRIKEKIEQLAE